MPSREAYEAAANEGSGPAGAQNLFNMIGNSKSLTGGWAGFALKSIMVSTSAATVFGLASWMLFQGPAGPALSFLGGSGFGFVGGLVSRWRSDVAEALLLTQRYPHLIEHHIRLMDANREMKACSFAEWRADLGRSARKQGIAIAAMYSAAPALERIRQEEEDAIVAAYASGEAA